MNRLFAFLLITLMLAMTSGCSREHEHAGPRYGIEPASKGLPVYIFAVHPLHNPARLFEAYQPLIEYLNADIKGARLTLEASRDYGAFEEKYKARKPDFILPNPWQTLQAMKSGYHVIAMAGEPEDFKGLIIVRKDSGIRRPGDLKGKAVSYPAPTALAACIMPQYFLHQNGVNVNRDIENRYVGSQESSIMNAYLGNTAAGATWPPPWRAFQREHPREAAELKVAWETGHLINNSVMARENVPAEVRNRVRTLLTSLYETPDGRAILARMETERFLPAEDKDYDVVRAYVSRFEREVRPVEAK